MELINNDEMISAFLDTSICFEQLYPQLSAIPTLASITTNNTSAEPLPHLEENTVSSTRDDKFDCEPFSFCDEVTNDCTSGLQWTELCESQWAQFKVLSIANNTNLEPPPIESPFNDLPIPENLRPVEPLEVYNHEGLGDLLSIEQSPQCHKKVFSLASPLQIPDEENFIKPALTPMPDQRPQMSDINPETRQHLSLSLATRSKSFDAKQLKGKDIFTYNFTNTSKSQRFNKLSKSTKVASQQWRPPLKPSVTITSIDTFSRTSKVSSSSETISKTMVSNEEVTGTASRTPSIVNVGNPFYKPIRGKTWIPNVNRIL